MRVFTRSLFERPAVIVAMWAATAVAAPGMAAEGSDSRSAQQQQQQQQPSQPMVRIRGTLMSVDAQQLVVKDRTGETITLARPADMSVAEIYPIALADIKQGNFIGVTALPQPDGTQKALEVHLFPENMRGTGEGHRPWDLEPHSTMTNATVAHLAPAPASFGGDSGREVKLSYPGGEKTVVVPGDAPIVSFKSADATLLVPGAKVLIMAQDREGKPTALIVRAGRNGFAPPM